MSQLAPDTRGATSLMILPTLACPAACSYCFGPHAGGVAMSRETLEAIIQWQRRGGDGLPLEITFHGGEPLVPGEAFYRMALPLLRDGLVPRSVRFSVQSNLWLLTDELCEIFRKHEVSLGTSLDGPEILNDAQRGEGYYRQTMAGIARARAHGLGVGCIATFTAQSAARVGAVYDSFLERGLGFSVHPALPALGRPSGAYALSPLAYGELLVYLLHRYLADAAHLRISTLDAMARGISAGRGGLCTFSDCLGHYLAVDPEGWIYPCQRMAGMSPFRLGNVCDCPSWEDLMRAPIWQAMEQRQERIAEACEGCAHLAYCRGGCPYNVLVANGGRLDSEEPDALRDPYCPAYRQAFNAITDRAVEEVLAEPNLEKVVAYGASEHGFLRTGTLLQIMRGGPHPQELAREARQAVAAAALGVCDKPEAALERLQLAGVIREPSAALGSLGMMRERLRSQSQQGLINIYLHVTDACNLACRHCYATARDTLEATSMGVGDMAALVRQAAAAGFAKVVITGGEPLMHPQREALLDNLAGLRQEIKPAQLALRTNLCYRLTASLMERLLSAADEIVVSVDGDRASHDAQRGAGTFEHTLANLRALLACRAETLAAVRPGRQPARLSIAAALRPAQMAGPDGDAVRALGQELDVRVRLKPVLPLGRGADLALEPTFYSSLNEDSDVLAQGVHPATTCGLGMNLYIGSDGACYPCYALMAQSHFLGNALTDDLATVLAANDAYRNVTVDSNRGCRACALRYLCGGFCRAWGESDANAPPPDCAALYARAERILRLALETLGVSPERWREAGLPLA